MCEPVMSMHDYIMMSGIMYFVVVGIFTSVSAVCGFSFRESLKNLWDKHITQKKKTVDPKNVFYSEKWNSGNWQPPVQYALKNVYVPLVPIHARFLASLLENPETKFQYTKNGAYRYNGQPIYCYNVNGSVYRFKFYNATGINYTDCISETMAGALMKLAKVLNNLENISPVFKEEPKNECGTNPS